MSYKFGSKLFLLNGNIALNILISPQFIVAFAFQTIATNIFIKLSNFSFSFIWCIYNYTEKSE